MLDKTVPHIAARWLGLGALLSLYVLRVWMLRGWYIVTYGLGIYLLSLFIGFISPQVGGDAAPSLSGICGLASHAGSRMGCTGARSRAHTHRQPLSVPAEGP